MADMMDLVEDEEHSNWLAVSRAVDRACYGISEYLIIGVRKMHVELKYGPCAGLPNCINNCSQTTTTLSAWCHTCKTWKAELMKLVKYNTQKQKIQWKNISSGKWPVDEDEVVKVFAPKWWTNQQSYWKDFYIAITIIHNCQSFSLPNRYCLDARTVRNTVSHSQTLSKKDYVSHFNILQTLIRCKEIIETESGKVACKQIEQIKRKNCGNPGNPNETQLDVPPSKQRRGTQKRTSQCQGIRNIVVFICVLTFVFGFLVVKVQYPAYEDNEGCVSMIYPSLWMPAIDFKTYVEDHTKKIFFGRKWLFEEIINDLQIQRRGIMLAAEIGYGKSAIVSHMVCANKTSPAFKLKTHILYCHVCKFNVLLTQRVDIFIKRLSVALMKNLPSFGNVIHMDNNAMIYLETSHLCAEDPSGCFHHLLVNPLKRIENQKTQYIVIDALDECYEEENINDRFTLLNILANTGDAFPEWIKFIITTRNIKHALSKFRYLKHYYLNNSDARNLADIETYLNSITRFVSEYSNINISPSYSTRLQIKSVTNGNFLFVVHALEFWVTSGRYKTSEFPKTFHKLLEMNFDRVFGGSLSSYKLPKQIFEVICTSSKPVSKNQLTKILNCTTTDSLESFEKLLGTKMSHFVNVNNVTVSITHKSICDFVSNSDDNEMPYSISRTNGHKMHAHNLFFETLDEQITVKSIIELITHVSESSDTDLITSFQKHFTDIHLWIKDLPEKNGTLLHELSRLKDSYDSVVLLSKVLNKNSLNKLDNDGATPAFLAASFGNTDTLKAILDNGGDVRHRINVTDKKKVVFGSVDLVQLCKLVTHNNYGLLDISAQNGHSKTVEALLKMDRNLINEINGIGLNALLLAVENGHTEVVEQLLKVNQTLADQHALYLASRYGHTEIVGILLQYGVNDTCMRCDGTIYWMDTNVTRLQSVNYFYVEDTQKRNRYALMDDETLLKCETALEAAVHYGHFDVIKLLLSKSPNALHCREYGGRTAILTSIKYNRTDMFQYLLESGANLNDRCDHLNNIKEMKHQMNFTEYTEFIRERCSNGSGVPHFVAMYGRQHMLLTIYRNHNRSSSFWNIRDSKNASALHYSACHNNHISLRYLIDITNSDLKATTLNGSTPYHSAVACGAILSLWYLKRYHSEGFNYVDNEDRTLMHYLSYEPFTEDIEYNVIKYILSNSSENNHWCNRDSYGNTFLHYAAISGNYHVLEMTRHCSRNITLIHNNKGMDVYDLAVDNLSVSLPDLVRQPKNCNIIKLIFLACNVTPSDILSPHEMFLGLLFHMAKPLMMPNTTLLMKRIIRRGNAPAILFLWNYIVTNKIPMDYEGYVPDLFASEPNIIIINHFLEYGTFSCEKPFSGSFLHRLMMNENGRYWYLITDFSVSMQKAIEKRSAKEWDKCFDAEGFNILHRAAMGGTVKALEFLLDRGLDISIQPKNKNFLSQIAIMAPISDPVSEIYDGNLNILQIITHDKHIHEQINYISFKNETTNFDKTFTLVAAAIWKERSIDYITICNEQTYNLSLSHVLAAKGMLRSLKKIESLFTSKALICKNLHGFTPRYFAEVFNHSRMIKYFNSKTIKYSAPKPVPEVVFLTTLLFDKSEFLQYPRWFSVLREFIDDYEHIFRYSSPEVSIRNLKKFTKRSKTLNSWIAIAACIDEFYKLTQSKLSFNIDYTDDFHLYRELRLKMAHAQVSLLYVMNKVSSCYLKYDTIQSLNGNICWRKLSYVMGEDDYLTNKIESFNYVQVIQFYVNRRWIAKSFESINQCLPSAQMSLENANQALLAKHKVLEYLDKWIKKDFH